MLAVEIIFLSWFNNFRFSEYRKIATLYLHKYINNDLVCSHNSLILCGWEKLLFLLLCKAFSATLFVWKLLYRSLIDWVTHPGQAGSPWNYYIYKWIEFKYDIFTLEMGLQLWSQKERLTHLFRDTTFNTSYRERFMHKRDSQHISGMLSSY